MGLSIVTPPAVEPLTLSDVLTRSHLRYEDGWENGLIENLIATARRSIEEQYDCTMITTVRALTLDAFPSCDEPIRIPRPPLVSVTSIAYVDSDGVSRTMSASDYIVDTTSPYVPRIALAYGESWPSTRDIINAVTITFTAGYGAAGANVPSPLLSAMLLIVGHLFKNRENTITGTIISEIPMAAESLIIGELGLRYAA